MDRIRSGVAEVFARITIAVVVWYGAQLTVGMVFGPALARDISGIALVGAIAYALYAGRRA